jgi:hypothetical protein
MPKKLKPSNNTEAIQPQDSFTSGLEMKMVNQHLRYTLFPNTKYRWMTSTPAHPSNLPSNNSSTLPTQPVTPAGPPAKYAPSPLPDDDRWNIWTIGNVAVDLKTIGIKLDVLREVLKECDAALMRNVLSRSKYSGEKLVAHITAMRLEFSRPDKWEDDKMWWEWLLQDGTVVDVGSIDPNWVAPPKVTPSIKRKAVGQPNDERAKKKEKTVHDGPGAVFPHTSLRLVARLADS